MTGTGNQRERDFVIQSIGMAEKLSEDIWYSIFLKLSDVKFILRCRSVCKVWHRLLCDPIFVRMHTNQHHQSDEKLMFQNYSYSFYSLDYCKETQGKVVPRDFPLKMHQRILGSCNGMLWIGVERGIMGGDWDTILWNPSTADYKILPDPRPSIMGHHKFGQLLGLGYCDEFKIVRFIYNSEYPQADVYTLKNNSWKKIIEDVSNDKKIIPVYCHPGIALNGYIYWLVEYQLINGHLNKTLLGFDLKEEKSIELPKPLELDFYAIRVHLTVIEGYLGIYRVLHNGDVVVWRMRELDNKKKEWTNMMTISSQWGEARNLYPMRKRLWWLKNGKVLLYVKPRFVLYDLKSGILESYHIHGINEVMCWVTYSESLFSPNSC